MSGSETQHRASLDEAVEVIEESPENLPPKAWVSYALFAVFVVGLGSCMSLWMFS